MHWQIKSFSYNLIFVVLNGLILKSIIHIYVKLDANIWEISLDILWTVIFVSILTIIYDERIEPLVFEKEIKKEKEIKEKKEELKMKMNIKREFFDAIKRGHKNREWRDSHITFVCEETGRELCRCIKSVKIIDYNDLPNKIKDLNQKMHILDGPNLIEFEFE